MNIFEQMEILIIGAVLLLVAIYFIARYLRSKKTYPTKCKVCGASCSISETKEGRIVENYTCTCEENML